METKKSGKRETAWVLLALVAGMAVKLFWFTSADMIPLLAPIYSTTATLVIGFAGAMFGVHVLADKIKI